MTARRPLILLLSLAALFHAACGKRGDALETAIKTHTLHIGNYSEPSDLDPHTNNSLGVTLIGTSLFEGLVGLAGDGKTIKPGVAEKWDVSPDGLTYTFHLRADAKWSNGETVTAGDFFAAFRRFLEPTLACEGVNIVFPVVGAKDFVEGKTKDFSTVGVSAPDARTFIVRLQFRAPYFLGVMADSHLVPVHQPSLDKFDGRTKRGAKWTQPGNLISNGPFTLKDWQPHVKVVVAKNPQYWGAARVRLNEIHYYPTEDSSAEERTFRTGQLQVTYGLPFGKLDSYVQRSAPELRLTPILRTDFVTFGLTKAPFSDVRVRRAFSLAVDRDRLASSVLKGRGDPARSMNRPGTGGYTLGEFNRYDPAEAKRLLSEAGFPGGKGFPAVDFMLSSRDENILTWSQALQQMWKQTLGVEVQLSPVEHKVWLDALRTKSFAMTTDNWNMSVNDPSEMLALAVTGDPNNDAGWSDPRYDAAFAAMNNAPDDTTRRESMIACEKLIGEEVPYVPVFFTIRAQLVSPVVKGWQSNPVQRIDWTALWLEAAK